jgi:hypothetical protein
MNTTTKEIRLFKKLADLEKHLEDCKKSEANNESKLTQSRIKALNAIINLHHKVNETWKYTDHNNNIYFYTANKKHLRVFLTFGKKFPHTLIYEVINDRLVSAKFTSHIGYVVEDLKAKLKDSQYSNLYR